jgi:hypothetical protein
MRTLLLLLQQFSFGRLLRVAHHHRHHDHARRTQRRQENGIEPRRTFLVLLVTTSFSLVRSGGGGSGGGSGGLALLLFGVFVFEGAFEALVGVALLVGWIRDAALLPQFRVDRTDIVLLRRTRQPTHNRPETDSHHHCWERTSALQRCLLMSPTLLSRRRRRRQSKNLPWTRPADHRCGCRGPHPTPCRFRRRCCGRAPRRQWRRRRCRRRRRTRRRRPHWRDPRVWRRARRDALSGRLGRVAFRRTPRCATSRRRRLRVTRLRLSLHRHALPRSRPIRRPSSHAA